MLLAVPTGQLEPAGSGKEKTGISSCCWQFRQVSLSQPDLAKKRREFLLVAGSSDRSARASRIWQRKDGNFFLLLAVPTGQLEPAGSGKEKTGISSCCWQFRQVSSSQPDLAKKRREFLLVAGSSDRSARASRIWQRKDVNFFLLLAVPTGQLEPAGSGKEKTGISSCCWQFRQVSSSQPDLAKKRREFLLVAGSSDRSARASRIWQRKDGNFFLLLAVPTGQLEPAGSGKEKTGISSCCWQFRQVSSSQPDLAKKRREFLLVAGSSDRSARASRIWQRKDGNFFLLLAVPTGQLEPAGSGKEKTGISSCCWQFRQVSSSQPDLAKKRREFLLVAGSSDRSA